MLFRSAVLAFCSIIVPAVATNGTAGCRCLEDTSTSSVLSNFITCAPGGGDCSVNVSLAGGSYSYSGEYGASSCAQWDRGLEPYCAHQNGTALPDAPGWCKQHWCWVDPLACDQDDITGSSYFPGSGASYSYKTCGSANSFSSWYVSRTCALPTSAAQCSELKDGASVLLDGSARGVNAFTDQMGRPDVCGTSPRPCAITGFLEAVDICVGLGGRLCTEGEMLNNEVGGTGCGFDASPVWTSTRGKCGAGEFMTVAGSAYNAAPIPLGKGLPSCAEISARKAVRCCGDDALAESNCPVSVATCGELEWPVAASASFCLGMDSVYVCAGSESKCYDHFARPCLLEELNAAVTSIPGFNRSIGVQRTQHAADDQCVCCADPGVMPEPCVRPHSLAVEAHTKYYAFEIPVDEARQCSWVFDGCPDTGMELRFSHVNNDGAVAGDGWRVFAAPSPVDLGAIQNRQWSGKMLLAEIHEMDARTFRRDADGLMMQPHGQSFSTREPYSEFVVTSPTSAAIVQLKTIAKGAVIAGGASAKFAVEYRCIPATGGCMDTAALNFDSNVTFDDGTCADAPSANSCGAQCGLGYTCTSNARRSVAECSCMVSRANQHGSADDGVIGNLEPFEAVLAPHLHEACASNGNSIAFIEVVNRGNSAASALTGLNGLHWFRFSGATVEAELPVTNGGTMRVESQTVIIEGMPAEVPQNRAALPEWNGGPIAARHAARVFVRRVAIRNKISRGNAAVASVFSGSIFIMNDVLLENHVAVGFHGCIWCHTGHSVCDFLRVTVVGNSAGENGGIGGWATMRFRSVEFRDNYALRGAAIFANRARDAVAQSCNVSTACGWLDVCVNGHCEIALIVENSVFEGNVAQGDHGGAISKGPSGFDVTASISDVEMLCNVAPISGSAIAATSVSMEQSRDLLLESASIISSPFNKDVSNIDMNDIKTWSLQSVFFDGYTTNHVVADTVGIDCISAATPPCAGGSSCATINSSIHCSECPIGTVSDGRQSCSLCKAGRGPSVAQDDCELCKGNNYSISGLCKPCPSHLVVNLEYDSCNSCPSRQTAVVPALNGNHSRVEKRVCGCDLEYVNATEQLHVCFASRYVAGDVSNALNARRASIESNACQQCPLDLMGDECLVCLRGEAHISAGFTTPRVRTASNTSGRRILAEGAERGPEVVMLFKCHADIAVAAGRCPACRAPPCDCAEGHTGFFCGSCVSESSLYPDGFGMATDGICEPCEEVSIALMTGVVVVGGVLLCLVLWTVSQAWTTVGPPCHCTRHHCTPC